MIDTTNMDLIPSVDALCSDLSIVNIVGTVDLGNELDLPELANDLDAQYEPDVYSSMVYQTESGLSLLVPTSGTVVLVGVTSPDKIVDGLDEFIQEVSALGLDLNIDYSEIQIQNIVVKGTLDEKINLTTLSIGLGLENTEYEPEQFPGVIYRLNQAVVLIFASGQFIIVGASTINAINSAYNSIRDEISDLDVL